MLFALATSRLKVHTFQVDNRAFCICNDLLTYDRPNLMASMSAIERFEFSGGMPNTPGWLRYTARMPIYTDILAGASQLRSLAFDVGTYTRKEWSLLPLAPEMLLVNDLANLTSLRITAAIVDASSLVEALRRCKTSLTHLTLDHVALSTIKSTGYRSCRLCSLCLSLLMLSCF